MLLPFGTHIRVKHPWRPGNFWVTNVKKSNVIGHNWQYEVRNNDTQKVSERSFRQAGEVWFDEIDIEKIGDKPMSNFLRFLFPASWGNPWPPQAVTGRRLGIWGANGTNPNLPLMLSWRPGAITTIYDYASSNGLEYIEQHPEVPLIIRFLHPQNWQENPTRSASDLAQKVIDKWPTIKKYNPYVYFANELNLGYESGQPNVPALDTREFYKRCGLWITDVAKQIKNAIPEIKLITPPWAFGHNEDGEPVDGIPKIGWAGYDYLWEAVRDYFDNTLTFHAYWPHSTNQLYDPELSSWYAFRWRRVLELFAIQYGLKCKMIMDEAGNMEPGRESFFDELKYFAEECLSDERVIAVTPFLWADPTGHNNINSWVANISDIERFCARLAALPDIEITTPSPEPEPDPEPIPPEPEPQPDPKPTPEPEPEPETPMLQIDYIDVNSTLIQGDVGKAGIKIIYTFWVNKAEVMSGHKPEFGDGGFQFNAYAGNHKLEIDGVEYDIEVREGKAAVVSFSSEPEEMVRLQTIKPIPRSLAEGIIAKYPNLFEIS